jgi:hypothetical protein
LFVQDYIPYHATQEVAMSEEKAYVRVDENGVYRVGMTRVMLDSVVAAFRQGHSAETIRQQYPALTLEEVYGSIPITWHIPRKSTPT